MGEGLPPQRRQGGPRPGSGGARGARSAGNPREGAEEAERRLGVPCFHAGQQVQGIFTCVTCRMRISNRGTLPGCPDCGELVWAYLESGPRPVPEGEAEGTPRPAPEEKAGPVVQENVKIEAPVSIQENVKLEP